MPRLVLQSVHHHIRKKIRKLNQRIENTEKVIESQLKEKTEKYPNLAKRMIYNGVCVATADGVLDPKEKEAAVKLAELVGLPASFVDEAYSLAKMEEEFKKKRGELVSGGHPSLLAKHYS